MGVAVVDPGLAADIVNPAATANQQRILPVKPLPHPPNTPRDGEIREGGEPETGFVLDTHGFHSHENYLSFQLFFAAKN